MKIGYGWKRYERIERADRRGEMWQFSDLLVIKVYRLCEVKAVRCDTGRE